MEEHELSRRSRCSQPDLQPPRLRRRAARAALIRRVGVEDEDLHIFAVHAVVALIVGQGKEVEVFAGAVLVITVATRLPEAVAAGRTGTVIAVVGDVLSCRRWTNQNKSYRQR